MIYDETCNRYRNPLTGRFVSFKSAQTEQRVHKDFYLNLYKEIELLAMVNTYRALYHVSLSEAYRAVMNGNRRTRG